MQLNIRKAFLMFSILRIYNPNVIPWMSLHHPNIFPTPNWSNAAMQAMQHGLKWDLACCVLHGHMSSHGHSWVLIAGAPWRSSRRISARQANRAVPGQGLLPVSWPCMQQNTNRERKGGGEQCTGMCRGFDPAHCYCTTPDSTNHQALDQLNQVSY